MHSLRLLAFLFALSIPLIVHAQHCSGREAADSTFPAPTIGPITPRTAFARGRYAKPPKGTRILLCIKRGETYREESVHALAEDSSFAIRLPNLDKGDIVTVQALIPTDADHPAERVGLPSTEQSMIEGAPGFNYLFVAGVEESSFSTLGLNTNPFLQAYVQSQPRRNWRGWGRVRVLGAPQASTDGVGSTFIDPAGSISKQDFTKIGTSVDVVGGTEFLFIPDSDNSRVSAIAYLGTTTPLSSQDVTYTFKPPPPGSLECKELLSRFTPDRGYHPGLVGDPTGAACLANAGTAVKDISFANQDRTNFFLKWGAGFRFQGTSSSSGKAPELGVLSFLDVSVGQDAVITGGYVRHFVGKADGILAMPGTNLLYIYGSVYTRFNRNQDRPPLILASEANKPTAPSADVIVLPLRQPDRDFFRLGVGLNLTDVISAIKKGSGH